jgi:mRNA-degrading endonuclease RelE of RelBE toxin-antitoxin system
LGRYKKRVDQRFLDDLKHIRDKGLVDPDNWDLFQAQVQIEFDDLDENWEEISQDMNYGPLKKHGYHKRYVHSMPHRIKQRRNWTDQSADFRIVFRVNEEEGEIYYLGIGKRIKVTNPRDPDDIWTILKNRKLPEEE